MEIEKVRRSKGYFEYNYLIYEKPHTNEQNKENNPDMGNLHLDNPSVEKQLQISTNEIIGKEDKTFLFLLLKNIIF